MNLLRTALCSNNDKMANGVTTVGLRHHGDIVLNLSDSAVEREHQVVERRRWRRWLGGLAVLAITGWLVTSGLILSAAAKRAQDGQAEMEELRQVATEDLATFVDSVGGASDDVDEEDGARQLQSAADAFGDAHRLVSSPILGPLSYAPVLGRQLRSVTALSAAAQTTASEAAVAFDELHQLLDSSTETGEARLDAARQTEEILTELHASIDDLDLGPSESLIPPLARARNRFTAEYARVMNLLEVATTSVTGVNDFLTGPTRYLVLAANNAEMRAGSGMFLQVGTMDVEDGQFRLDEFAPTGDLFVPTPSERTDPDVRANWGWLLPDQEWRNTNLTPRFDQSARMAADMWESLGRGPVDGVIAVDVVGLRKLLEVVGPVDVGDTPGADTVSADTVERDLLVDQYAMFESDRDARRDRLGAVVRAAFEAFNTRPVSASSLLQVLQTAGEQRHMLLWGSEPVQQDAWTALGASGQLSQDSVLLSLINRGGNKLDPFVNIRADISAAESDGNRRLSVSIEVENSAPDELPSYVSGPFPNSDLTAGEYLGILALTVPGGAGNVEIAGTPAGFIGEDGATRVITTTVVVPRGATARSVIEFDLPDAWDTIVVQPSARIPPTSWTAGLLKWQDSDRQLIALDTLGGR